MARQVRVQPPALADLRRIAENIRIRVSTASAKRWSALLRAAIDDLAETADTHPEAEEAADLGRNLRVRFAGKRPHIYRILFTFTDVEVNVLCVRHAAQDRITEDDL